MNIVRGNIDKLIKKLSKDTKEDKKELLKSLKAKKDNINQIVVK